MLLPSAAARAGRCHDSWIPFFGGLFGALACVTCPLDGSPWLASTCLLLDASYPLFVVFVVQHVCEHRSQRRDIDAA